MMRGPIDMPLVKRGMMRGPVDMPLVKIGMMRGWVYPHAEKTEGTKYIYPSNIHTIILHTYTQQTIKIRNGKNCHLSDIHTPLRQ